MECLDAVNSSFLVPTKINRHIKINRINRNKRSSHTTRMTTTLTPSTMAFWQRSIKMKNRNASWTATATTTTCNNHVAWSYVCLCLYLAPKMCECALFSENFRLGCVSRCFDQYPLTLFRTWRRKWASSHWTMQIWCGFWFSSICHAISTIVVVCNIFTTLTSL